MKRAAERFAQDMLNGAEPRWISFLGSSGAGKTMLAKIILRLFRQHCEGELDPRRSHNAAFWRYKGGFINWGSALNERMMRGEYGFLDDVCNYSFFVLDEILSEYDKHRELSAAKLYHVLERRLGKWTVITANAGLGKLGEKLDVRIVSRMLRGGSTVAEIDVIDFSLRPKPARGGTRSLLTAVLAMF